MISDDLLSRLNADMSAFIRLKREQILVRHSRELFGVPPVIKDGKLTGGTGPDMEKLTRLLLGQQS